ncbi:TYRO protein tyrosine kinase-binding protein-like [Latimeria chalumnae]|uniref:TYRO protein tyrosine kinase-binding protein-like n=1 Tax=Latimeria chalumnae TaxID=7897 RepID=UPI00313E1BE5
MENRKRFFHLLLTAAWLIGSIHGQRDCSDCYRMDAGALAGVVIGDILITVLIALSVFFLTNKLNKSKESRGDLSTKQKKKEAETESPYQELQVQSTDIYSDLKPSYK